MNILQWCTACKAICSWHKRHTDATLWSCDRCGGIYDVTVKKTVRPTANDAASDDAHSEVIT